MPFGDGRGPLWAQGNNNFSWTGRGFGRGLGRGLGRGYGFGYWRLRRGYGEPYYDNKSLLEEEKRYLQERLREIDSLLNR